MFGRKAREQIMETENEEHIHERALYWKRRFDEATDDHQTTRVFIEYRGELLFEWLGAFDRRLAEDARHSTRQMGHLIFAIYGLGALILMHHVLG